MPRGMKKKDSCEGIHLALASSRSNHRSQQWLAGAKGAAEREATASWCNCARAARKTFGCDPSEQVTMYLRQSDVTQTSD
jgi:hypothetical protein